MIESILVIIAGIILIFVVRKSRSNHAKVNALSAKERDLLKENVNAQIRNRKLWLLGGSFTHVPAWAMVILLLVFIIAIVGGLRAIT